MADQQQQGQRHHQRRPVGNPRSARDGIRRHQRPQREQQPQGRNVVTRHVGDQLKEQRDHDDVEAQAEELIGQRPHAKQLEYQPLGGRKKRAIAVVAESPVTPKVAEWVRACASDENRMSSSRPMGAMSRAIP